MPESTMQTPFWWADDCVPRHRFRPYTPGDIAEAGRACTKTGFTYILLDPDDLLGRVPGLVCLVPTLEGDVAVQWQACLFQPLGREIVEAQP